MGESARDEALFRQLESGEPAWFVTVTERLAFTLTARVAELRAARGIKVAETPPIRSLADWTETLGRRVLAIDAADAAGATPPRRGRVLLAPAAEQLLWQKVIASMPGDLPASLLDTEALASTCSKAWERVCLWGEPSWTGPMVEDVEAFRSWLTRFRARLEAGAFVTTAELPRIVADRIRTGVLDAELPRTVYVLGFEQEDPALEMLCGAWTARGIEIRHGLGNAERAEAAIERWTAADPSSELRGVAIRIREKLTREPDLRIGVLAPDVGAYGAKLERVFEEELDPAGVLDISGQSVRRFDFSESPALADYPMIASALDLLSLGTRSIAFEAASRVLLSEYPRDDAAGGGRETERVLRGQVEAKMRRERCAVVPLAGREGSLATSLRKGGVEGAARRFESLARHLSESSAARRSPSAWRRDWIERLETVGWPGAIAGDVEGLVFRRWRDALDAFAMLETVEPDMREAEALRHLRAITGRVRVQPPASSRSVAVMNLLDSAALEFDVVFVIGLVSTAFPASPSPNPLLPVAWQRNQRGMPRVSVEAERRLAERIWSRVVRSAGEVIASWPATGDRDEEHSPSAVVAGIAAEAERVRPWWLRSALAAPPREVRPDDAAGPALVRSGAPRILQQQSDCGFRAFAAIRLGADRLASVQQQPDRSLRGTLVHAALEEAYRQIPSSTDLIGLSDENIAEVAHASAIHAIERSSAFFADAGDLESAAGLWLEEMVGAWMRYERDARGGDWEVVGVETKMERKYPASAAAPLTLRFRPDRIDRIEGGARVILDFKTSGSPKGPGKWKGERPEELQLPLYLALLDDEAEPVRGVAFANLSARDECRFDGVADRMHAKSFKPPKIGFDDTVVAWKVTLEALATGYLAGEVRADPRKPNVCTQCGGHALCRVHELGPEGDAGDDEDAE